MKVFKLHIYCLSVCLGLLSAVNVHAQKLLNDPSVGVELRSNGIGIASGISIGESKHLISHNINFSLSTLKHSKETKFQNPRYINPKPYVYGKMNNVFRFDLGYSINRTFGHASHYEPEFQLGIEVIPTFAFKRPYYVVVQDLDRIDNFQPKVVPHNPEVQSNQNNINGSASWTKGFSEMTVNPGISVNVVLNTIWQQSYHKQRVKTFYNYSFYPQNLGIMYGAKNQHFSSLGLAYYIALKH